MKVLKHLNNISEELRKTIPEFGSGQTATFKLINGGRMISVSRSVDGVREPERKMESFGSSKTFRLRDRIKDPFTNQFVDIGVPKEYDNERMTKAEKYTIQSPGENVFLNGYFTLSGNNHNHVEIFEFLWLSNKNESNPHRDPSVQAEYKYIDYAAEKQRENKNIDQLITALKFADDMSTDEVRQFAAMQNWDLNSEDLKADVKRYAKDNPKGFLELFNPKGNNKFTKDHFTIKAAMDNGIIIYDPAKHAMVWGESNTTAAILEREEGKTPVDLFYDWTTKVKNGQDVLRGLQKKLSAILREKTLTEEAG